MVGVANLLLGIYASITLFIFFSYALISLREDVIRAAGISGLMGTFGAGFFLAALALPLTMKWGILLALFLILLIILVLFFMPIGRIEHMDSDRKERFDERDIVFSRTRLEPGSKRYREYYETHPEKHPIDEKNRANPGLLSPKARKADPLIFPAAGACFDLTETLRDAVDGPIADDKMDASPGEFTSIIKGLALHLGAVDVGVAQLKKGHIYSHIGRGSGNYGDPIELPHRFAIAFTVEMDYALMGCAPDAPVILESARKYVDAAMIAIELGSLCRRLGYPARAHIDGNYRVIAPLVARDAGLGEIGRMGILMTPRLGPRVRLGIITTDLPLVPDPPFNGRGMIDFCGICLKCAENCPSLAISFEGRTQDNVGLRWKLDEDRCFSYWKVIGTDCGLCMTVCPYSHPDNWAHNLVRSMASRSGFARRAARALDDLYYGRKPAHRKPPDWVISSSLQHPND